MKWEHGDGQCRWTHDALGISEKLTIDTVGWRMIIRKSNPYDMEKLTIDEYDDDNDYLILPNQCATVINTTVYKRIQLTACSNTLGLTCCPITAWKFIVLQCLCNFGRFGVRRPTTFGSIWSQPCNRNSFYRFITTFIASKRHHCISSFCAL